ncbi:hypothetical protein [Sulfurimonas sp.]|jgi:hypothetical protein|uniref:hypothetical protein n=1 Tax=Sulfurimonas sp. TaxID=2022749 RepID=UPI0025D11DD1|nr:hypothetical protein [Sulfurimonas sp.]MBT5934982.1 hypothetical protein [Sulfurimonas sp.]
MKELFKRVNKLEGKNKLSHEVLFKLYQPILYKIIRQVGYFAHYGKNNPANELTKREEKICDLYEEVVRADPALYENSIFKIADRTKAEKINNNI